MAIRKALKVLLMTVCLINFLWVSYAVAGGMWRYLGVLPGKTYSIPGGISGDGNVVAGYSVNDYDYRAFRWTLIGGMTDIGTLGGLAAQAAAVSYDGTVVVGTADKNDGTYHPFRWTMSGGMAEVPTLGGIFGNAYGLSPDGTIIVGSSQESGSWWEAFRLILSGSNTDLDPSHIWVSTQANAVSADGSVVVGTVHSSVTSYAFRWTQANNIQTLNFPSWASWATSSKANAISSDGSVIVGVVSDSSKTRAFRWTQASGMVELPPLASGQSASSYAFGVSSDGSVVVGTTDVDVIGQQAFRWTAVGGMQSVDAWLTAAGVDSTGIAFFRGVGVSADGNTVTGYSGDERAYIARACTGNPAKILSGSSYTTISNAYSQAGNNSTIQLQAVDFSETLDFNKASAPGIKLQGGFACNYSSNSGLSVVKGSLTFSNGVVTVENVVVQ